jgi:hypothetical protein
LEKHYSGQVAVAYTYKPSYSGGRDQENHGSKPVWANSSPDLISKKPFIEKGWWSVQGVDPEFKPQYHKKTKPTHITQNTTTYNSTSVNILVLSPSIDFVHFPFP